ncbi:MAG TPA: histidine kinase [Terriglobales bacterium]|nr:histidine kinase [Terriglobales bacterium]
MDQRLILITLLVKLGVAAAIASALVRAKSFKTMLFREERTLAEKVNLVLFAGFPFALGVMVRGSVRNFLAADLAFEAALLIGVIGGRVAGVLAGVLVSLPGIAYGEFLNIPFNVIAGLLAGSLRTMAPDYETIWTFSPFVDLSVYRWVRKAIKHPRLDWHTSFFLVILLLTFIRIELGRAFPDYFFSVYSPQWAVQLAIYASTVMVVAIPLKIFNSTRMEIKLEEQERMLLQARMEALQSQINPHFLFNTLNSVSSLVRFDPDTARELIVKLANILRRLLRKTDAFVPLQEELDFIDDYLDIEVVRFGKDKLNVIKELEPASLEVMVPSMLLQPLVENSIKHGLSPKIEGGRIHIRSKVLNSQLIIEVEDDGVGMGAANFLEQPTGIGGTGIGMANVIERLKVLYGDTAGMTIDSRTGEGTLIRLRVPILATVAAAAASPMTVHEGRGR